MKHAKYLIFRTLLGIISENLRGKLLEFCTFVCSGERRKKESKMALEFFFSHFSSWFNFLLLLKELREGNGNLFPTTYKSVKKN